MDNEIPFQSVAKKSITRPILNSSWDSFTTKGAAAVREAVGVSSATRRWNYGMKGGTAAVREAVGVSRLELKTEEGKEGGLFDWSPESL